MSSIATDRSDKEKQLAWHLVRRKRRLIMNPFLRAAPVMFGDTPHNRGLKRVRVYNRRHPEQWFVSDRGEIVRMEVDYVAVKTYTHVPIRCLSESELAALIEHL